MRFLSVIILVLYFEFSLNYIVPNHNSSHLKRLYIVKLGPYSNTETTQTIKWPPMNEHQANKYSLMVIEKKKPEE